VAAQQDNLAVLYLYCNSFFIRDVHREFGVINVHSFDNFVWKSRGFFSVWRVVTLFNNSQVIPS